MCTAPRRRSARQSTKPPTNGAVKAEGGVVVAEVSTTTLSQVSVKTKTSKRKVKEEEREEEDYGNQEAQPKKRKTTKGKAGKKDDAMSPLAARTVVMSLKKAMYIGAHVSSAGGRASSQPVPPPRNCSLCVAPCSALAVRPIVLRVTDAVKPKVFTTRSKTRHTSAPTPSPSSSSPSASGPTRPSPRMSALSTALSLPRTPTTR